MKLIVGLGNPGREYAGNRHNVGFMYVDRLADSLNVTNWRKRFQSDAADARIGSERVLLLKPQTYMNESGQAVGEAARFLKIDPEDVIVFYDEIDLAPGKLKVKSGGGNAGHNGLRSISAHLGNDYVRVRIGVGHPGQKNKVANYVLRVFTKTEHSEWLDPLLDGMVQAIDKLVAGEAAKFTGDVSQSIQPDTKPGKQPHTPEKSASVKKSEKTKAKSASRPHPAGERANKRQSALAENLQNWLKGQRNSD